jgi:transglutaminase-like putative cysteine protease
MEISVSNPETLSWLPTPGRATEISVADLGVDEATGDVVVPAGSAMPASYRVTGAEPVIGNGEFLDDEPARATAPLGIPLPADILGFATTTTGTGLPDSDRLLALYKAFTNAPFGYDGSREAAGGHGIYQISALLRDKRGTSEQYASAFAVMCRYLGWDARVVLGFRPQWNRNTMSASGKDIHAWTEVRFDRLGWVPIDPTPQQASPGREPDDGQPPPPRRNDPLDSVPDPGQQPFEPPGSDSPPGPSSAPVTPPAGPPTWLIVTIFVGAMLILLLAAIPPAKAIQRARRRRTGSARRRTVAAWHDVLDTLRETGQRVSRTATTGEIADTSSVHYGPAIRTLAALTDFAAFAPDQTGETDAEAAWTDSDTIRRTARRHIRAPARIRAIFDPRPLLNRHWRATAG